MRIDDLSYRISCFFDKLKDLRVRATEKFRDHGERIATLETKADTARTVLQDHEARITALENE